MPDSRKKVVWMTILAVLGALLFIFYVVISSSKSAEQSGNQPIQKFSGVFAERKGAPGGNGSRLNDLGRDDLITPAIEAFGEAVSSTFDQGAQNFSSKFEFAQNEPSSFQIFSSQPTSAVTVTEKEIFIFGYSEEYKSVLREINQGMIDIGYLKSGEVYKLDTMADAIALQDRFADWLEYLSAHSASGGGFSADEIAQYRKSYREILPKLWEDEIKAERTVAGEDPRNFISKFKGALARKKSEGIISWIGKSIISRIIPEAYAQFSVSPECYRGGTPNNQRGSQRSAPCCNCGFFCTNTGCTFRQNCGPSGGACNIQLGCLNKVCANLPAIWDPQTRICGCHIGGGGTTPPPSTTPTPSPTPSNKKYTCNSNNQCVEDASGQYSTSNCDNKCPTGLKCSADKVSAITNAMVSCVISKAAAAGLSVPQPASNQLNQGCHRCQFSGNTDIRCSSFSNRSPTKISCHYGGPSCNGTGHAADFSVSPASASNWNKLMKIITDVTTDSSGNPIGCGRYVRGARCENNKGENVGCDGSPTHIHANDADQCGCD